MNFVLWNKFNPHTPARIRREQTPKLLDLQFFAIDLDHRLPVFFIVYHAPQHTSSWRPLVDRKVVFDLLRTQGRFDSHVLVFSRNLGLCAQCIVERVEDILIAHF